MRERRRSAPPNDRPGFRDVAETIVARTSLGIWTVDADDRTTFVNSRMADILGVTPEAMLGASLFEVIAATDAEATREALERRRDGVGESREVDLLCADGTVIHTMVESLPLIDEAGTYCGAVAMIGDISQ